MKKVYMVKDLEDNRTLDFGDWVCLSLKEVQEMIEDMVKHCGADKDKLEIIEKEIED